MKRIRSSDDTKNANKLEGVYRLLRFIKKNRVKKPIDKLINYIKGFGLIGGVKIAFLFLTKKDTIKITLPKIQFPIRIRANTTDFLIFERCFLYGDYRIPKNIKPKLIIDGGAYVGYVSILFANKFPNTEIIAIEPEKSNFRMLKCNTSYYPNIKPIKTGLWNKNTYIKIKKPDEVLKSAFQIEETLPGEQGFESTTIGEILKNSGHKTIDILKLDVEGSEKEIFSDNYEDWLDKVKVLIVELHDRCKPGCGNTFYSAIKKYDFKEFRSGEHITLIRKLNK